MSVTIFFDMDGVLADFQRAGLEIHGRGEFPYRSLNWNFWEKLGLTAEQFWAPIDRDFWARLPRHEDGFELLRRVERLVPKENIALLTSNADGDGCYDGKREWLRKHLPEYLPRLCTAREKGMLAAPNKVLVDDSDKNIRDWYNAGGQPVLVPRPWNELDYQCTGSGNFNVDVLFGVAEASVRVAALE